MTGQNIVDVMNDLLKTDPGAIDSLLCNRVPVNEAMLNHPTAMCFTKNDNGDFPTIGLLGILNAIVAIDNGIIQACYDDDTHCITEFKLVSKN